MAVFGYSIMPLIGIRNEHHSNELKIIPVRGLPIKTTWSLIWLKVKKLSPVAKSFIAHLNIEKNKIIHEIISWYEQY